MAALTEASIVLHGLLRQRLLQQRSSDCRPHDEVVQEGRRNPSTGLSPRSLVLSITGYWLPMPCSYCSTPEHCKLIFTDLSPFPSQPPCFWPLKGGFLASHIGMQRGTRPSTATWEPAATQDARAAVSSATKITSRLSTYFRTIPSCRATQPNYSRLLLYLLMDAACVCPAYCTFPCKGLPHSLLCSELSSGRLPHTC